MDRGGSGRRIDRPHPPAIQQVPSLEDLRHRPLILISSRSLSFLNALRPPVKQRRGADEIGSSLQGHTALGLGIFQVIYGGEVAGDETAGWEWRPKVRQSAVASVVA